MVNETCPRYVAWRSITAGHAGLGDRFFQTLLLYSFALDVNAVPLQFNEEFYVGSGIHGNYAWALEFLQPYANVKSEAEVVEQHKPTKLTKIGEHVKHNATYQDRVARANRQVCNVIIETDIRVCGNNTDLGVYGCYYLREPKIQRARNILACNFLKTNRASLPALIYDRSSYNVAIHVSSKGVSEGLIFVRRGGVGF
jgi:hypothetical protein